MPKPGEHLLGIAVRNESEKSGHREAAVFTPTCSSLRLAVILRPVTGQQADGSSPKKPRSNC